MGLAASLTSCWGITTKNNLSAPQNLKRDEAYVPVYKTSENSRAIRALPPQPTVFPGKIYVFGNLLFQIEKLPGIHVINYADRSHPIKIGFIKSRGCSELAVKNGYLITNNLDDLVTIDISNPADVKESARIPHAFADFYVAQYAYTLPPERGKYYVCPDFSKGEIVEWKLEKDVQGANCYNY